jgi:hypothetical protein
MSKRARVAILMIAMVVFAVTMLDLVRSKVEASGRALKTAALQYSSIKKIYTPGELVHAVPGTNLEPSASTR